MSAQSSAQQDPLGAVRAWYLVAGPGSWVEAHPHYGTLGGTEHYREAYSLLAPQYRSRTSIDTFLSGLRYTAYMRLDQAELVEQSESSATVYVEDERDMILDDLPATVRYSGKVDLMLDGLTWRIAAFDLAPEYGIIAGRDAGHGSSANIGDMAMVALARHLHERVEDVNFLDIQAPRNSPQGPVTAIYRYGNQRLAVEFAKLFSGEYVILTVHPI